MADINSVVLVGRLVRDSEIKYTQAGQAIVRFSIAVNRARRAADGKWEEEPNYFDCVYFGKGAESISPYLDKGRQVAIQGELRQSRWESEGQTRSRIEVAVSQISLGQGSSANQRTNGPSSTSVQPQQGFNNNYNTRPQPTSFGSNSGSLSGGPEDFQDDSIPF